MCRFIFHTNVAPGYGCCHCQTYNGLQRTQCKFCEESHCELTIPDDARYLRYSEFIPVADDIECIVELLWIRPEADGFAAGFKAISGQNVGYEWAKFSSYSHIWGSTIFKVRYLTPQERESVPTT